MVNKEYKNSEGKPVTLERLCREEPEWTANRIRHCNKTLDKFKLFETQDWHEYSKNTIYIQLEDFIKRIQNIKTLPEEQKELLKNCADKCTTEVWDVIVYGWAHKQGDGSK